MGFKLFGLIPTDSDNKELAALPEHIMPKLRISPLGLLIKGLLVIGMMVLFYYQILQKEQGTEIWELFLRRISEGHITFLIATLALIPFNWGFEVKKWLSLVKDKFPLSAWKAAKAVLAGITISLFTPNRIGEYGGRVLFLPKDRRWEGAIATLVGSLAQLIVLLGFGFLALVSLALVKMAVPGFLLAGYAFLGSVLLVVMIFGLFNLKILASWLKKIKFLKRFRNKFKPFKHLLDFSDSSLRKALLFAGCRYLTYFLQYYLLARYFGLEIGIVEGFMVICSIFFVQTSVPLPPIWSLLVRGEAAIFFWGLFILDQPLEILACTFSLWILNLILPAIFGVLLLIQLNIPVAIGYESQDN